MNKAVSASDAALLASYLTGDSSRGIDEVLEKCQQPAIGADEASQLAAWLTVPIGEE